MLRPRIAAAHALAAVTVLAALPAVAETYHQPPAPIPAILDAPRSPRLVLSPDRKWMLELELPDLPPISVLARPWIPLAGTRVDPATNGPAREIPLKGLKLRALAPDSAARRLAFPEGTRIRSASFTDDSRRLMITTLEDNGISLWVADIAGDATSAATPAAITPHRLTPPILNAAIGSPCDDLPGDAGFLCKLVPEGRGPAPKHDAVPEGPIVEESRARKAANRTYQNLLKSPHDEALFEHHATATLEQVGLDGRRTRLAGPAVITRFDISPDGRYVLVDHVHRPWSYQVPSSRFPLKSEVIDREGRIVHVLADLPLADDIPITFDSVRRGPRSASWRADKPANLAWAEALDGGDAKAKVAKRDALRMLDAPFTGQPVTLWESELRFAGTWWAREDLCLVSEFWYDTRRSRTWRLDPGKPGSPAVAVLDYSSEDAYANPGRFLATTNEMGEDVLRLGPDGNSAYLSGPGASPKGEYPFLDRIDLATGGTQRLWRAEDPWFEHVVDILDDSATRFITRRESAKDPMNYMLHARAAGSVVALTSYPDPAPQFAGVSPEIVTYQRADGVELSAKLYTPPGWTPAKGPLPTLFWIYPQEFKDKDAAGRVTGSNNVFVRPGGASHLLLLTQGYAIVDDPTLPIIGEGETEPNDTYVRQLVMGAEAAVDFFARRGVADRNRLAVGGHSYGAFTTANLLAHTDLFRAGIGRSGAYNRTLTPFGFQGEQRNFWEATATYVDMSPFTHAAKINEPLLLIHGGEDSNPGTFPVQSERLQAAVRGLGGAVRWVVLPMEDHGYRARESVGHALWEMDRWMDEHVRKAKPPEKTTEPAAGLGQ